jgi:hypothetical protein
LRICSLEGGRDKEGDIDVVRQTPNGGHGFLDSVHFARYCLDPRCARVLPSTTDVYTVIRSSGLCGA